MRIAVILLCVCTYGFLNLGEVSAQTVEPQRAHPVPMIVSDANQEYTEWQRQFIDRKATYYFETGGYEDACDLTSEDLNSSTYIWMMNQMLHTNLFAKPWVDNVRGDERAFYHLSDPACLTLFSSPQGVEIRWRLDNRDFISEASHPAVPDSMLHRDYRIHRRHGASETYTDVTVMPGDDFGSYTDTLTIVDETYEFWIETLENGLTPKRYSNERRHLHSGLAESAIWLTTRLSLETQHPDLDGSPPSIDVPEIRFAASGIDPANDVITLEVYRTAATQSTPALTDSVYEPTTVQADAVVFADVATLPSWRYEKFGGMQFRLKHVSTTGTTFYPHDDDVGGSSVATARYYNAATCNRILEANFPTYIMNPTNVSWRSAVKDMAVDLLDETGSCIYEGVWADNTQVSFPLFMVRHWNGTEWSSFTPYEYAEVGADSAAVFREGMALAIAGVDAELPAGSMIVANGIEMDLFNDFDDLDAVTLEGTGWTQGKFAANWITRHDSVVVAVDEALLHDKKVHFLSKATFKNPDQDDLPQVRLFDFASYLTSVQIVAADSTYIPLYGYHGNWTGKTHEHEEDYGEPDDITPLIQPEQQIDLGIPVGPAQVSTTNHVAHRKFSKGEVFLNFTWDPTKEDVSIDYILGSFPGLEWDDRIIDGEPHRLHVETTGRTTSGGRIGFVPVARTDMLPEYSAAIILYDPPAIPYVLSDAQSSLFDDGDNEWDLELRVVNPDTMTHFVEADISKLSTTANHFVQLYDDGSNGDDVAGDMIFTRDLKPLLTGFPTMSDSVLTYVEDARGYYQFGRAYVHVLDEAPAVTLRDKSTEAMIAYDGTPYSAVPLFCDGDDGEDLIVTMQDAPIEVMRWDGALGQFIDIAEFAFGTGFDAILASGLRGVGIGDYDNDGHEDLFISHADDSPAPYPFLYRNQGPPFTQPIYVRSALLDSETTDLTWSGTWGDFNDDGWLDLYLSRADIDLVDGLIKDAAVPNAQSAVDQLLVNDHGQAFMSDEAWGNNLGMIAQPSVASAWLNADDDASLELVVPALNDSATSTGVHFFDQGTTFDDRSDDWLPDIEFEYVTSVATADLDNDGDLDLVMTQTQPPTGVAVARPYVLVRDNVEDSFALNDSIFGDVDCPSREVKPLDFDLDGRIDLLVIPPVLVDGDPPRGVRLYRNTTTQPGPLTFVDVTESTDLGQHLGEANGCAVADYDRDGAPDVFIGKTGDGSQLGEGIYYLSEGTTIPPRVTVELQTPGQTEMNRSCIGAVVTVKDPTTDQILSGARSYGGGDGRGGDSTRRLMFGLTQSVDPVVVETRWQHGYVQRDTVSVNSGATAVVDTITEATPPTIDDDEVDIWITLGPSETTWAFEWDTEYEFFSAADTVFVEKTGTGYPSYAFTASNAPYTLNGNVHSIGPVSVPCEKGTYEIRIKSTANGKSDEHIAIRRIPGCAIGF